VPESCSQSTYDSLQKLSPRLAPEFHVLKDREHEITLDNDDGLTLPFLRKYSRGGWPERISFKMEDLTFPRRNWIEVVDMGNGAAEVEGQIKGKNTIELSTKNVKKLRLYVRPEMFTSPGAVRIVIDKREAYRGEITWCATGKDTTTKVFDPLLGVETALELAAPH